jgi:hypothetical protein
MKMYYIISLKHTSKGDTALTFWRDKSCGYCWGKNYAGLYSEQEADKIKDDENVPVDKETVDKFWMNAVDFKDEYVAVPNNLNTRYHLGITDKFMKPKKYQSCRMQFINTPVLNPNPQEG